MQADRYLATLRAEVLSVAWLLAFTKPFACLVCHIVAMQTTL